MSQCKNRIGERCKLNGEICPHLVYDGKCENAEVTSIGKATFAQALGVIAAFYNLRYWSAQDAYVKDGALAESLKHGHTRSVAESHYYNKNDHRMRI